MSGQNEARFDLPVIEPDGAEWWSAIRDGRLLLESCRACGSVQLYPRGFCVRCWSEDVGWTEASGRGTVYSYSTVYVNDLPPFRDRLPYVVAMVDLDEGPA